MCTFSPQGRVSPHRAGIARGELGGHYRPVVVALTRLKIKFHVLCLCPFLMHHSCGISGRHQEGGSRGAAEMLSLADQLRKHDIGLPQWRTLLLVAMDEEQRMTDYIEKLGVRQSVGLHGC